MVARNGPGPSEGVAGRVGLAEAIQALRAELTQAISQAPGRGVRFGLGPIELTVEAAVTTNVGGKAGIRWWLIDAGGEVSREAVTTQTLKLTLDPVLVQENPEDHKLEVADILVTDTDTPDTSTDSAEPYSPLAEPE